MKYDDEELLANIVSNPFKERQSVRKLSAKIGIPRSTIQAFLKPPKGAKGCLLVCHVSKLKPTLTELNKVTRFEFAMEQINTATMNNRSPKFFGRLDKVHLDEKWFNLCQDGKNYILVVGEEPPKRHVKHRNFITKVMFLCAQVRPRWDYTANKMWDGKLGIWPIGKYTKAQRASINRAVGTTEWINKTVDHESYLDLLVNHVLTSIMDRWPVGQFTDPSFVIKVQQDGAGGHISHLDEYLNHTIEELGLKGKVEFYTQPANSLDLNILDLGLFNALQAEYYDTAPTNSVELIQMVERTYDEFPSFKINRLFVTLQTVFNSIIEDHGGNSYKITHLNKDLLEREDRLPIDVTVTAATTEYQVHVGVQQAHRQQLRARFNFLCFECRLTQQWSFLPFI
jgi:hypothetical protein